jgi:hypothetical protein
MAEEHEKADDAGIGSRLYSNRRARERRCSVHVHAPRVNAKQIAKVAPFYQ